jgi:ABC-type transporter Mla MlaB component
VSDLERDLKDLNFNKLSFDEQLSLEGEINVNEASKVLQTRGSQEPVIAHLVFNLTSEVDRKWGCYT